MFKHQYSIPIDTGIEEGSILWPFKHTAEELDALEKSDPYTFSCQEQQNPKKKGGNLFKESWWQYYAETPEFLYRIIVADTAIKAEEKNDWTVFQCWGRTKTGIYLIDQWRDKVESIYLEDKLVSFWNKHNTSVVEPLRMLYVEDKASGSTIIQGLKRDHAIPVKGIPRSKSKLERSWNLSPRIETGRVYLPKNATWLFDYVEEFNSFSPLMTHKHDDQIDPTLDAIEILLVDSPVDNESKVTPQSPAKPIAPSMNSKKSW